MRDPEWYDPKQFRLGQAKKKPTNLWWLVGLFVVLCAGVYGVLSLIRWAMI